MIALVVVTIAAAALCASLASDLRQRALHERCERLDDAHAHRRLMREIERHVDDDTELAL